MAGLSQPARRRGGRVRAAALVGLGLGAGGCDEAPPPDVPGQAEARLEACEAAHRRLGADPAACAALERVARREQAASRPVFDWRAGCEMQFGREACEATAETPAWRPVLEGWSLPVGGAPRPVLRDRQGQGWALSDPGAIEEPPRPVERAEQQPDSPSAPPMGYERLAPLYATRQACEEDWQRCEQPRQLLPNRFASREECAAVWSACRSTVLPSSATAQLSNQGGGAGGSSGGGYHGGGRGYGALWWYRYNSLWHDRPVARAGGYAPRYQGWSWTADRRPIASYRPSSGTGPLQGWDSAARRALPAHTLMARASGGGPGVTVQAATSISRAGFGSTGRSYSAGG